MLVRGTYLINAAASHIAEKGKESKVFIHKSRGLTVALLKYIFSDLLAF